LSYIHFIWLNTKALSSKGQARKSSSVISEQSIPSPDEKKSRNDLTEEDEDEVLTALSMVVED